MTLPGHLTRATADIAAAGVKTGVKAIIREKRGNGKEGYLGRKIK
jgi:hypothetical protein